MAATTDSIAEESDVPSTFSSHRWGEEIPFARLETTEPLQIARTLLLSEAGIVIAGLTDAQIAWVVTRLKEGADRHWLINPNESLQMADAILRIGRLRDAPQHIALGLMSRADALKYLGRAQEAWDAFQQAGDTYRAASDEIGWARTRIGMLVISASINAVEVALSEAEQARSIFLRRAEFDFLTRLDINVALVYSWLGDATQSLFYGTEALRQAESPDSPSRKFLGLIYTNCGSVHANLLGDYQTALDYFRKAKLFAEERQETKNVALAELDLAYVATQQGRFREALQLLRHAHTVYQEQQLALDATHVDREMVECYIHLRRFEEARDLAKHVVAQYQNYGEEYYQAHALLNLATACAELNELSDVQHYLDAAEELFRSLRADSWSATARLRRGRLALRQHDAETALREATFAEEHFSSTGLSLQRASAAVVRAEALLLLERPREANDAARAALVTAKTSGEPLLRHSAHLALGRLAEYDSNLPRAARHYQAAVATIDRVQHDLTLTLRPGFLEDKGDALRSLIKIRLQSGDAASAFAALEHAKSLSHLGDWANRDQLRWATTSPESQALLEEIEVLRDKHRWLYKLAHDELDPPEVIHRPLSREEAIAQLAANEHHIRSVVEQLYLNAGIERPQSSVTTPTLRAVQEALHDDSLLIEFYHDGSTLYAFVVDISNITVYPLSTPLTGVERLLAQLQMNMTATLSLAPRSPATCVLHVTALRLLEQLYQALLAPLESSLVGRRRLYIVPFGALHYLPFHLLWANDRYLLQDFESVILPAAGLLLRESPQQSRGARVVAYSAGGFVPQVVAEANMLGEFFTCDPFVEDVATRRVFEAPPTQILHIAAHAAYRLDQPDFSYIELADGQLYADDLMQQDLSYELVTLSACETGRAHIAARDELIGLGRGFLNAGAGAMIASLWRIGDEMAIPLMRHLYCALHEGQSKAAALQHAQQEILAAEPTLHPAYWGPFQLIGDARPLSDTPETPVVTADGGGLVA